MIALTLALAVPIVYSALGRVGSYDVVKAVGGAAEARAIYRPAIRASLGPQSLGPVAAAPMAAFPVSPPPPPLMSR